MKQFHSWFLHHYEGKERYKQLLDIATNIVTAERGQPFSGATRNELENIAKRIVSFPTKGHSLACITDELAQIVDHSLWISHPHAMAHLHCPPLVPSVVAETVIAALNQSMDSWDQSPMATYIEKEVISQFSSYIGYEEGDGVFTSGGTQSNYMGLLLARNEACYRLFQVDAQKEGLPVEARKLKIICSAHAHFTVQQSAAQLGLGMDAVVTIQTDTKGQMCLQSLQRELQWLRQHGDIPFAIVATAGTTDFGSVDPLEEIGEIARREQLWLHVDAAYGGALLFSHLHKNTLKGIVNADSITIDFHKLYWQTVSCGAFFVKNKNMFSHIAYHASYLNPIEDEERGVINLVDKSIQTTKRFDALKIWLTYACMGTNVFGEMVDGTIATARETARILKDAGFEVLQEPILNAIVFRYVPKKGNADVCNIKLQQYFYEQGTYIMAKTKKHNRVYLKFTMLNPLITIEQMITHIEQMQQMATIIEREEGV